MIIREAKADDVDSVYELIMALAKDHQQEQFVTTTKEELLRVAFGDQPKIGVLLAEIDNRIAGFVSYTWNYSIWSGSSYMSLDDLFVWKEYRGQQVGEALMLKAKDACLQAGFSSIKWEVESGNHKAIKFYERLGAVVALKGLGHWNLNG